MKKIFLKNHGYPLDLDHPQTFCEWVNYKKIHDRNPLIPITSDKYRVRQYLKKKLGNSVAEEISVPILYLSQSGKDIPFEKLDREFFLKANHCSGSNLLVRPGMDPDYLSSTCARWLGSSYGQYLQEWAYRDIPRRILCEEVLRDSLGNLPLDYKFYCIHGEVEMIGIFQKSDKKEYACYLDRSFQQVGGPMGSDHPMEFIPPLPNLPRMIDLAEKLAEDFELVRIDLYSFDDRVFFGEITHYPGSGLDRFASPDLDLRLGKKLSAGRQSRKKAKA